MLIERNFLTWHKTNREDNDDDMEALKTLKKKKMAEIKSVDQIYVYMD